MSFSNLSERFNIKKEKEENGNKVYFIQGNRNEPIKIGKSNAPYQRVKQIQSMSPVKLDVILVIDGGHEKESELHEQFKEYRSHGEWFYPAKPVLEYIIKKLTEQRNKTNKLINVFIEMMK